LVEPFDVPADGVDLVLDEGEEGAKGLLPLFRIADAVEGREQPVEAFAWGRGHDAVGVRGSAVSTRPAGLTRRSSPSRVAVPSQRGVAAGRSEEGRVWLGPAGSSVR